MYSVRFNLLLVLGFLAIYAIQPLNADNPCICKLLSCNCCQSVATPTLGLNKTLCVSYKLGLIPLKVDVNIQMDGVVVAAMTIDPKNPPEYCIPIVLPNAIAACLKFRDIKLIGLTGVQICSTFYVKRDTDKMFTFDLPCVKLGTDGITMIATAK